MRTGTRDTQAAFSSRVVVLLLSLAIQSTLAWLLGPEGRGTYAVCLLFATLLGTLFSFSIDVAGQYFVASRRHESAGVIWTTLLGLLACSMVAIVVGRLLMETDFAFLEKAPRSSFMIALLVIPFSVVGQGCILLLVGLGRITRMAITMVAGTVVQLAVALVLIWGLGLGVNGALLAVAAAGATNVLLGITAFRRIDAMGHVEFSLSRARDLFAYGLKYYVARLSGTVNVRVGTMILAFFASTAEIGIFAAASGLVTRVILIPTSIENALFSRVAADDKGKPRVVAQAARVSGMIVGFLLIVLAALARPVVMVLLSPKFLPVVRLVWILIPGVLVRSASKVLMSYFTGTNRPSVCSWAVGLGMAVNLIGVLVLFPVMGLTGAAWAMTLGFGVSSTILIVAFGLTSGISPGETWLPRGDDMRIVLDVVRRLYRRVFARRKP